VTIYNQTLIQEQICWKIPSRLFRSCDSFEEKRVEIWSAGALGGNPKTTGLKCTVVGEGRTPDQLVLHPAPLIVSNVAGLAGALGVSHLGSAVFGDPDWGMMGASV